MLFLSPKMEERLCLVKCRGRMMVVYLCDDGFDGILTGVYDVYASRIPLQECRLELRNEYEPQLFAEYVECPIDKEKAEKVSKKIRSFMSEEAYIRLYRTALHKSPERADCILRFIEIGLRCGRNAIKMLQEPVVYQIFCLDRYVGREAMSQREFVRFERLPSGVYYSKIGPENQVLELIAGYFADRLPDENWVIYDEIHRTAAIYSAQSSFWVLKSEISDREIEDLLEGKESDCYTNLWKIFFHAIAIEERKNEKCQRNHLPLRYRKYMTEFQ